MTNILINMTREALKRDEHIVYHPRPEGATCGVRGNCCGSKLPSLQLEASERPAKWAGIAYTGSPSTGFTCSYCGEGAGAANTIQQHCKKHFPPEHACLGCDSKFHIKTDWDQHHFATCDICQKTLRVGSMANHKKTHIEKTPGNETVRGTTMKVTELRDELRRRGMITKGLKAVLWERLLEARRVDDTDQQKSTTIKALEWFDKSTGRDARYVFSVPNSS